jgi:hypothetical protein
MKKLGCANCGGKMKPGGTVAPRPGGRRSKKKIEKAEDRNSEAKALGYESWAAMKESKNEQKGRRAQNAGVWTGAASAAVGVAEGIRRLFDKDKQKRGGTIKSKKVTSRPKKRK